MLLGGLWHGANWTFVLWGLLHGIGLAVHKLWSRYRPMPVGALGAVGVVVGWTLTYAFVCVGWILFRSSDLATAMTVLGKVVGRNGGGIEWFYLPFWFLLPLVVIGHVVGVILARRSSPEQTDVALPSPTFVGPVTVVHTGVPTPALRLGFTTAFVVTIWAAILFLFTPVARSPFIYFRF
jgi:hypothetical protein